MYFAAYMLGLILGFLVGAIKSRKRHYREVAGIISHRGAFLSSTENKILTELAEEIRNRVS